MTAPTLTESQKARVDAFLRGGAFRVIPSPAGTTVIRVSWAHQSIRGHGATETGQVVKWVAWSGQEYLGSSLTKREAVELVANSAERSIATGPSEDSASGVPVELAVEWKAIPS